MKSVFPLLISALYSWGHSIAEEECLDFTVSDCTIDPELIIWENDQVGTSAMCQLACHNFNSCKEFRFYQGNCQLFSEPYKTSCGVIGGRADKTLEDCTGSVVAGGCDYFIDEQCDYLGEESGFSAPPGEVTSAAECEGYCKGFQVLGAEYWVWGETNKTCDLLKSSDRTCWGISGPKDPEIQECKPCQEEQEQFIAEESVYTQPPNCSDGTAEWTLAAGEDGSEIERPDNGCASIALGSDFYQDVEFSGSFINLNGDDDWIGFVFGYQDMRHFYIVSAALVGDLSAGGGQNHSTATAWKVSKVASETGNSSSDMISAILYSAEDVEGQITVLYKSPDQGWQRDKENSWVVTHRPSTNSLSISVFVGSEPLWSQEWEHIVPGEEKTGKVGVFAYSQPSRFYNLGVKKLCPL